jgi:hypothetical protein
VFFTSFARVSLLSQAVVVVSHQRLQLTGLHQLILHRDDFLNLLEEPRVNVAELVDFFRPEAGAQGVLRRSSLVQRGLLEARLLLAF